MSGWGVIATVAAIVMAIMLVLHAQAAWRIRRGLGTRGLVVLGLRLLSVAVLLLLVWLAFGRFEEPDDDDEDSAGEASIVVLQDRSASMRFEAGDGRPREALAEAVATRLLDANRDDLKVERYFFAGNLVPEADEARLDPRRTELNRALMQAMGRLPMQRLVVVSDGIGTDGAMPGYLADWAANRQLEVFAVCTALPGDQAVDIRVAQTEARPVNPSRIEAKLEIDGEQPAPVTVRFEIDGRQLEERRLAPGSEPSFSFSVPELPHGWHEFAVEAVPLAGEVTTANNLRRGVFQIRPPERILVLHGAPRIETLHVTRFLQKTFEDRVETRALAEGTVAELAPGDFQLLIVSGLSVSQLPAAWRLAVLKHELPVLVLAGNRLEAWGRRNVPESPLKDVVGELDFQQKLGATGFTTVSDANELVYFRHADFGALTLNLLPVVRLQAGASEVLSARAGNQRFPLLVADAYESPKMLIMLADTTWKWIMHPDPRVRHQYRLFWDGVFAWLTGADVGARQLAIEFEPDPEAMGATLIRVVPTNRDMVSAMDEVRLQLAWSGEERQERLTVGDDGAAHRFLHPAELPVVVWCQGAARLGGEELATERRPLLLETDDVELLSTWPEDARLEALVGNEPQRFAWYPAAKRVIEAATAPPEVNLQRPRRRERNPWFELTLGGVLLILFGAEWLLERQANSKQF